MYPEWPKIREKLLKSCKRSSNRPDGGGDESKKFSDTPNMFTNTLRKYDVPYTTSAPPYPSISVPDRPYMYPEWPKIREKWLKCCKRFSNRPDDGGDESKKFSDTPNIFTNTLRKCDVPYTTSEPPYPSISVPDRRYMYPEWPKIHEKWLKCCKRSSNRPDGGGDDSKIFSDTPNMFANTLQKYDVSYNTSVPPYPSFSVPDRRYMYPEWPKIREKWLKSCKRSSNRPDGDGDDSKKFSDTPNMFENTLLKYDVPYTTSAPPYPSISVPDRPYMYPEL